MELTNDWYLVLSVIMFTIGAVGLLLRRNPLVMFMCVELMLNAVNVTFVSLGTELNDVSGQIAVFFVLVVAAVRGRGRTGSGGSHQPTPSGCHR